MTAYLLVHSAGGSYGLPLRDVLAVLEAADVVPVPGSHPSVRGVSSVHGRLVPRVALGALLAEGLPSGAASPTIVVAQGGERTVAFEVDDVDLATQDDVLPLPAAWHGPSAVGVARHGDELVPLLDIAALVAHLTAAQHRP